MDDEKGIHIAAIKGTEDEVRAFCKMVADKYEMDIKYITLAVLVDDAEDGDYQLEISMIKRGINA